MSTGRNAIPTRSAAALLLAVLAGCSLPKRPDNPSFPLTKAEARADLARMEADRRPLERPVVFLAGIGDPAVSSGALRAGVMRTLEGPVVEMSFIDELTFDGARAKVLRETAGQLGVEVDALPEVDVVAFSMGGIVARFAAMPDASGRFLRIKRLYTLSSPHEGARMAAAPFGVPQGDDMVPTSDFIARLRETPRSYELVCYGRLDDATVGEEFAAPEGEPLWWLPTPSGEYAHMSAFDDPRIHAELARRLRGETPHTRPPAAPLPH
jgi:hypothetical protein